MGSCCSKTNPDVDFKKDVESLIEKLEQRDVVLLDYESDQIINALQVYKKRTEVSRNVEIKSIVDRALYELHKFPKIETKKNIYHMDDADDLLHEMKKYVFKIEKKVKSKKLSEENALSIVTTCSQILDNAEDLKESEKNALSILFFKLFLKAPNNKTKTLLTDNLDIGLKILNLDLFEHFGTDDLKQKLTNIKSGIDAVLQGMTEETNRGDETFGAASETTDTVEEKPHSNETDIHKLQDKILPIVQSNLNFEDKVNKLKSLKIELNSTTPDIIEAYMVIEIFNLFLHVKESVDRYKTDVLQFPFPTNTKMYKKKNDDILSLMEHFVDLPIKNTFVDKVVQNIRGNINTILQDLEEKALRNEKILSDLRQLETIEDKIAEISSRDTSEIDKLKQFNALRREIENVSSINSKIVHNKKKSQIKCQLQVVEKTCLEKFSDEEQELKSVINKYEDDYQSLCHRMSTEMYLQKTNEISTALKGLKKTFLTDILSETIDIILENLENTVKRNNDKNNAMEKIKFNSETKSLKKEEKLLLDEEDWDEAKHFTIQSNKVENAKMKVTQLLEEVKIIGNDITMLNPSSEIQILTEKLSNLLYVKYIVVNMPKENVDLDNQKNELLEEISNVLRSLDFEVEKKQSINILHLEDQFKKLRNLDEYEDTFEFVRVIRNAAEDFEESASQFLGSKESIDYYIIHENLLRLLEKLDTISIKNNDELMSKVLEAMTYIKNLLNQLERNTK